MVKPVLPPALALLVAFAARLAVGDPAAQLPQACDPPSMALAIAGQTLAIAAPELQLLSRTGEAPGNHFAVWRTGYAWPGRTDKHRGVWNLTPRYDDEDGAIILGGFFRQLLPETLKVVHVREGTEYVAGRDYLVNTEWAQVAAIDDRLGQAGQPDLQVSAQVALQRIDLLQLAADGTWSIKRGQSRLVCPRLPEPDAGCRAVAGIYVAPWRRAGEWKVLAEDIFPIRPAAPVAPINPEAVAATRAKLTSGQKVKIAFMGDSITLGAEAGRWWSDDSTTWRGRVVRQLRQRYPKATVQEIQAFQGGRGIVYGEKIYNETVVPAAPDLLLIQLGINDASNPGRGPRIPADEFAGLFENLVAKARQAGMEVLILTSMQTNPFAADGDAQRWPEYVAIMKEVAARQGAAVADTCAEWLNLASRGIPPYSQLHNWINHPGADGHALFAEVVMRFFEP